MPGILGEADATAMFILGAAAIAVGGLGLLGRAIDPDRGRQIATAAAMLGLSAFSVATAATGRPRATWLPPLLLVATFGAWSLAFSPFAIRAVRKFAACAASRSVHSAILLCAGLSLATWCGLCSHDAKPCATAEPVHLETFNPVEMLQPVDSPIARTDKGRRVRLFTMPKFVLPPSTLELMEDDLARETDLSLRIIRQAAPEADSDCHGWIFADGRWWIVGEDVPIILEDNGYKPVTEPKAGDLVIYRYGARLITHSGIVFSASDRGRILVESKWSWLGTYLHGPEAHPYGGSPHYYRSPRPGHRLAIDSAPNE